MLIFLIADLTHANVVEIGAGIYIGGCMRLDLRVIHPALPLHTQFSHFLLSLYLVLSSEVINRQIFLYDLIIERQIKRPNIGSIPQTLVLLIDINLPILQSSEIGQPI
jgi:hypothetical protein